MRTRNWRLVYEPSTSVEVEPTGPLAARVCRSKAASRRSRFSFLLNHHLRLRVTNITCCWTASPTFYFAKHTLLLNSHNASRQDADTTFANVESQQPGGRAGLRRVQQILRVLRLTFLSPTSRCILDGVLHKLVDSRAFKLFEFLRQLDILLLLSLLPLHNRQRH